MDAALLQLALLAALFQSHANEDRFKTETTLAVVAMEKRAYADGSQGWTAIIPIRRAAFDGEKVPGRGTILLTITKAASWDIDGFDYVDGKRSKSLVVAFFEEKEKYWVLILEDFDPDSNHAIRINLKPKSPNLPMPTIGAILYSK